MSVVCTDPTCYQYLTFLMMSKLLQWNLSTWEIITNINKLNSICISSSVLERQSCKLKVCSLILHENIFVINLFSHVWQFNASYLVEKINIYFFKSLLLFVFLFNDIHVCLFKQKRSMGNILPWWQSSATIFFYIL